MIIAMYIRFAPARLTGQHISIFPLQAVGHCTPGQVPAIVEEYTLSLRFAERSFIFYRVSESALMVACS